MVHYYIAAEEVLTYENVVLAMAVAALHVHYFIEIEVHEKVVSNVHC